MRYFIGIDATDNIGKQGTLEQVRFLAKSLAKAGFGYLDGITRHQLLVDPKIRYTFHNTSLCLVINAQKECKQELAYFCRDYLLRESMEGFGTGLCVASSDNLTKAVTIFGEMAKKQVLCRRLARELADDLGLVLEELKGDGGSVIGAMAAVGLHYGGNDGQFQWLKGLDKLQGVNTAHSIYMLTGIEEIRNLQGREISGDAWVKLGKEPRPLLRNGRAVLFVDELPGDEFYSWQVVNEESLQS